MRIKKIAKEAGWEIVGEAGNGEEAVLRYKELRPDLMTLDIVMPKMDGLAALRNSSKNARRPASSWSAPSIRRKSSPSAFASASSISSSSRLTRRD